jgi:hypothetical protein
MFHSEKCSQMKNFFPILLLAMLVMACTQSMAQRSFNAGDKAVNLGLGLFGLGVNASAEYGIQKNLGVGAYFSYERVSSGLLGAIAGVSYGYNEFHVGARATYHLGELLKLKEDKIDFYVAGGAGVNIYRDSYDSYFNGVYVAKSYLYPQIHLRVGGRYFLTNKTAAWVETGTAGSWLQGGIAFKL